jgi:hypothetical protein
MSAPLDALLRIIEGLVGPRLDHLALYPCRVVAQSADLTRLDLQPDSARVPPCAGVPIRHGIPGVTVTVPVGARVLLGYAGGDPAQPYAALWEAGSVTLVSFNGGSTKVARDGESVTRSSAFATWMNTVSLATGAINPGATIGTVSGGSTVLKVP